MSKRYGLKGINDEASECSLCGKAQLKRVMWIVELDKDGNALGDPSNYGTSCGAQLLGYTYSKVNTKIKSFQEEVDKQRRWLERQHPSSKQAARLIKQLNAVKPRLSFVERGQRPEYIQMKALKKEAREWASNQEVIIEL